jgi:hypothetical protein
MPGRIEMRITYPTEQVVSIWIGTFVAENDFDQSVDEDVAKRLNLRTPIESICEVSFERRTVSVRELLEGFSGWEKFIEESANAGRRLGVDSANAALVCYYLKCEDAPDMWGQLRFLGSFVGQDVK